MAESDCLKEPWARLMASAFHLGAWIWAGAALGDVLLGYGVHLGLHFQLLGGPEDL